MRAGGVVREEVVIEVWGQRPARLRVAWLTYWRRYVVRDTHMGNGTNIGQGEGSHHMDVAWAMSRVIDTGCGREEEQHKNKTKA